MSDWVTLKEALNLTLRPINEWPEKMRSRREPSKFTAPLRDTLSKLKRELRELNAKNIVLQIAIREQDLRLDGLPRAGAIASHPGIILAFDSKHGPLRLFFDRFTRYEHNLRAIAFHLEHLRMASLYGVGKDGQQYKGWTALPPPEAPGNTKPPIQTPEQAAMFIVHASITIPHTAPEVLSSRAMFESAYRLAAKVYHPDQGGDHEDFVRLQQAAEILRGHFAKR